MCEKWWLFLTFLLLYKGGFNQSSVLDPKFQDHILPTKVLSFKPNQFLRELSSSVETSTNLKRMLVLVAELRLGFWRRCSTGLKQGDKYEPWWWRESEVRIRAVVSVVKCKMWERGVQRQWGKRLVLKTSGISQNSECKADCKFRLWEGWGLTLKGTAFKA